MAVIGYSKLMKEIFSINVKTVEELFFELTDMKLSGMRIEILKKLSKHNNSNVSFLLRECGFNNTGGSYKTINKFFLELEDKNILVSNKVGKKTIWNFSERMKELKYFLRVN